MLPDGVDMEIFDINISQEDARRKLDLPLNKKILAYTGKFKTMDRDKGINNILNALKILNNKNIIFAAVGGSDQEIDYYKKKAKEFGVIDQVVFKGLSPQSDLAVCQKAADILMMPFPYNRHYAYYMSPLKMFEYMAAKRPIIVTDLPSIREVLNENNSVIVKPCDSEDLAKGINNILDSQDLAEKAAMQAYKDVDKYTWERRVEKILNFVK